MSLSTAVGTERKSRVSGYKIKKGTFDTETGNLPQIIAVFGQANSANNSGLSTTKKEITSAQEAAETYGYGSPIHQQIRILRPINSDGVGGIPTVVFPQAEPVGATATENEWTVTGTATSNATHSFVINGRRSLDFQNYSYTVLTGETPTQIAVKIADAINGVLSSPVSASANAGVVTITTKWAGASSAELNTKVDNGGTDAGVTYSQTDTTMGTGNVDLSTALAQFDTTWYNTVVHPYGSDNLVLAALEAFNGIPDENTPTGRYVGIIFRPFVALFGSTEDDKDNLALITGAAARKNQVTNVLCPAPNSEGFSGEAAANACAVYSRIAQDTPELDVNAKSYPDMPVPDDLIIGDMSDYNNRDFLVKLGCSTVILENGSYQIQDFVTTYHPDGENPLQYAYVRNLNLDWNVKDAYDILEANNVRDHVLVQDGQVTDASRSVKPSQWTAVLYDLFEDLAVRALIREPDFSKASLSVEIDSTNPDRFNTFFRYKRTGIARIESTDVEAGF